MDTTTMNAADEFIAKVLEADGGTGTVMLPWGDAPRSGDRIRVCHPDRPDEPVAWIHNMLSPEGWLWARYLRVKKSFVEDCLAGNVKAIENPRQWLFDTLKGHFDALKAIQI